MDNEIAVQNLTKMAQQKGLSVQRRKLAEGEYRVLFTIGRPRRLKRPRPSSSCRTPARIPWWLIGANTMGAGAEELGKTLPGWRS